MSTNARLRYRLAVTPCALATLVVAPVAAQTGAGRQVELGSMGTLTEYDDSLDLDREFGGGARLGLFLTRVFSLEGNGDYTVTHRTSSGERVDVTRLGGTLYAHGHLASWTAFYLGAGYERSFYRGAEHNDVDGAHVILGERISLGGRAALRIEGRGSFSPPGKLRTVNLSAAAGLSVYAFGGAMRDADKDAVADRRDQCPGTPAGATVDTEGCPSDSDGDTVLDGLDACAATPAGANVDPTGCPSDSDADGVFDGIDTCPETPQGAAADAQGCPTDEDADGIFDGLDSCPGTPQGATTDERGCPFDEDADGVFDGLDRCPRTPSGLTVDEVGCPTDQDGDGVFDAVDACPGTPPNTEVDQRGCAIVRDSDRDGVPDGQDRCPNTAPGQRIDGVGCPILFMVEEGQRRALVLQGVTFASGRSVLTDESYATLDEVAASLIAHPEVRIEIAGHTDATGNRDVNTRLSLARARAVMAYLAQKGVAPGRMEARGYGPDQPIATNGTAEGRARNRRVELKPLEEGRP